MTDRRRIHNILFAILLGIVLGVTAYALHTRMPSWGLPDYSIPRAAVSKERKSNETERMIESGELSDHKASYYKVLE